MASGGRSQFSLTKSVVLGRCAMLQWVPHTQKYMGSTKWTQGLQNNKKGDMNQWGGGGLGGVKGMSRG